MKHPIIPRFSSRSNNHYTPGFIGKIAHQIMGGVDLDPASCAAANQIIQASAIFTAEDDGLCRPWFGRVFLNPPSARVDGQSQQAAFAKKLFEEYEAGRVHSAFMVGSNPGLLYTSQDSKCVIEYPFCLPRKRIAFLAETSGGKLEEQTSPPNHNVLLFLPPRGTDHRPALHRFYHYTRDLGWNGTAERFCERDFV